MRADPKFKKWCRWLEDVRDNLHATYFRRDIFVGTMRIAHSNPRVDVNSLFFGFFQAVYVDSVAMAIRRQIKTDRDSISLALLLEDLVSFPSLVTRAEFVHLYGKDAAGFGERDFALYAEVGEPYISASRVRNDLSRLCTLAKSVEEYADRRIAHWDKREPSSELTINVIFEALDELGALVKKYYLLLVAADLEVAPVPQGPVYHVFQEPWLNPAKANNA